MSHFAEINSLSAFTLTTEISAASGTSVLVLSGYQATVQRVLVVEQDFIDSGILGDPAKWIQCSYNHRIRNQFPGPGFIYESIRDIFYPPQPYPSWNLIKTPITSLDENNNIIVSRYLYKWTSPVSYPAGGGSYYWNESTLTWDSYTS